MWLGSARAHTAQWVWSNHGGRRGELLHSDDATSGQPAGRDSGESRRLVIDCEAFYPSLVSISLIVG